MIGFGQVLPERWRPSPDYEIMFPNDRDYRNFLQQSLGAPPKSVGSYADIVALTVKRFARHYLFGSTLPVDGWSQPSPGEWAANQYWQSSLRDGKKSHLSFPMIGRLVELLLRLNAMAREALRLTYSHLFMDEFQDTTQIQYDLVRAIFLGADTIVTAVGDNKQQIMRWAMAMDDPFAAFDADFKPKRIPLYNNYRSSPELVRIQHILAQSLDAKSVKPVSKTVGTIAGRQLRDIGLSITRTGSGLPCRVCRCRDERARSGASRFCAAGAAESGRLCGCIATCIRRRKHPTPQRSRASRRDHAAGASYRGGVRADRLCGYELR